jgi:hypothetical protein
MDRMMGMSKQRWAGIAAGVAGGALLVWAWVRAPKSVEYETIEIRPPEGFMFGLLEINDNGVVGGHMWRTSNGGHDHLFVWDHDNGLRDLGIPAFISPPYWIRVSDINNLGQLIGVFGPPTTEGGRPRGYECRSFFYDPRDGFREIGALKAHWNPDVSFLNDRGQVVGTCEHTIPNQRSVRRIFIWDPETGLRDTTRTGSVWGINEGGQILVMDPDGAALSIWSPDGDMGTPLQSVAGPIACGFLGNTGGFVGQIMNIDTSDNLRIVQWNPKQGYPVWTPIGKQVDLRGGIIAGINERMILFITESKPFDWFGLVKHPEKDYQICLYTVGEELTLLKGIPVTKDSSPTSWDINRNGWIVCVIDQKAYVMIPKGKAGKK